MRTPEQIKAIYEILGMAKVAAPISPEREKKQMDLWQQWRDTGDDQVMSKLLDSLTPLFKSNIQKYSQYPITYNVLLHQAMVLGRNALDKYDPSQSKMNTYLTSQLQPMDRFVKKYQNVAYLPEFLAQQIGRYEHAEKELVHSLDRAPTIGEMAEQMKMPEKHIERIQAAKANTKFMSGMPESMECEMDAATQQRLGDNLHYLRSELSGEELKAFDLLSGMKGQPVKAQEVAKKLNLDVQQVYSWRRRWTKILSNYM